MRLVDCPGCQASGPRKLLPVPGFRLKGGGCYETDFQTGARRNLARGDRSPACAGSGCGSACVAAD